MNHVQKNYALHGSHHVRNAAVAQCAAAAFAVQPSPVKRTIMQRADVPGTNLETIYASLEIAAGFKAGRHNHPGVVMAHIVEGDFWLQLDGEPERVLHAGESLTIPDRAIHNEGATDKPVKLDVVYVVEKGKPLVSPAQ
ncbi:MAG TPA: cupin domain-containing protein [Xanthobacteraceae bacterium]|nr:cupin domain-containing protein [Xanthobacteraceae bacterium]